MPTRCFSIAFALPLVAAVAYAANRPTYEDPDISAKERQHWSFLPPKRPVVPPISAECAAPRNAIDNFVFAKLQTAGLKPSPEADRLTLARRVTFDLTGLPPTPKEIDAFLADKSPDAYEKLVDRLLASPHYGERWAQHWLDVVRFAETNGYEADGERPQAWRYRDYVIRSLNADKPYNQFVTEQVAGDILAAGKEPRAVRDLWFATGMNRCGQVHKVGGNVDQEENRQEVLIEMVNGLGSAVLGLTVGCARCHDHKFDPISQGDYYRLQAFFAAAQFAEVDLATDAEKETVRKKLAEVTRQIGPLKKRIAELEAPYRAKLLAGRRAKLDAKTLEAVNTAAKKRTPEQKKLAAAATPQLKILWDEVLAALSPEDRATRDAIRSRLDRLEAQRPKPAAQAWAIADDKKIPDTYVLKRGDIKRKTLAVKPAYPRVLTTNGEPPRNRLDLARWLTGPRNALTARVIVNRLWAHHFGRGIVDTPNDFGTRGGRPTHPKLLDWLACELVQPTDGGEPWTLKRLHRLMVCSATYRQLSIAERGIRSAESKTTSPTTPHSQFRNPQSVDPENKLLWRMNRRRLEAESIRDAVLAAAGTLTPQVGGPSVRVPLEPEVYDLIFTEGEPAGLWPVTPDPKQHTRRSIYLFLKRNVRLPILEAFDQPDTLNSCARRPVSTFAPQALILMNGPFARAQSRAMAADLTRTAGPDAKAQVTAAYRRALGRLPRAEEVRTALGFLKSQTQLLHPQPLAQQALGIPPTPAEARALADLCLAILNTNEFVYVP
jgi:hypothetical protein